MRNLHIIRYALALAALCHFVGFGQRTVCPAPNDWVGPEIAQAQPSNSPTQQEKPNSTQNSQASATPTSTPSGKAGDEQPHTEAIGNSGQQNQQPSSSDSSALINWLMLAVNIFLLLIVIIQSYISHQQRKIMQETIKSAENTERAYIGIGDMQVSNLVVGQRPTVTVEWVNGGRTPALHFRAMPILIFSKEPATNKMYFIDDDISPIRGSFFPAGSAREVKYPQTDKITEADFAGFENGSLNAYIIGNLLYVDVRGVRRVERICAIYDRHEGYVYECYEYSGPNNQS